MRLKTVITILVFICALQIKPSPERSRQKRTVILIEMPSLILHMLACIKGTARQNPRLTMIGVHIKLLIAGYITRRDAHHEPSANFSLLLLSIFVQVFSKFFVSRTLIAARKHRFLGFCQVI